MPLEAVQGGLSGPTWGPLGALQGRPEDHLGRLGGLGAVLGASWAVRGPAWGPLGRFEGHLGGAFGA
eukprot:6116153-Pyramimonas_sp.AAC.1